MTQHKTKFINNMLILRMCNMFLLLSTVQTEQGFYPIKGYGELDSLQYWKFLCLLCCRDRDKH